MCYADLANSTAVLQDVAGLFALSEQMWLTGWAGLGLLALSSDFSGMLVCLGPSMGSLLHISGSLLDKQLAPKGLLLGSIQGACESDVFSFPCMG